MVGNYFIRIQNYPIPSPVMITAIGCSVIPPGFRFVKVKRKSGIQNRIIAGRKKFFQKKADKGFRKIKQKPLKTKLLTGVGT